MLEGKQPAQRFLIHDRATKFTRAFDARTVRKPRVRQPDNNDESDHQAHYDSVPHLRRLQGVE
jgi:hypothetical protein